MEKLIDLLNEYEIEKKPSRLQRNYYLGFVHNFGKGIMYIDEEGEDVDDYKIDYEIINQEYGFIEWLCRKGKIDKEKMWYVIDNYFDQKYFGFATYEYITMLLSIQENPIEFLIYLLI